MCMLRSRSQLGSELSVGTSRTCGSAWSRHVCTNGSWVFAVTQQRPPRVRFGVWCIGAAWWRRWCWRCQRWAAVDAGVSQSLERLDDVSWAAVESTTLASWSRTRVIHLRLQPMHVWTLLPDDLVLSPVALQTAPYKLLYYYYYCYYYCYFYPRRKFKNWDNTELLLLLLLIVSFHCWCYAVLMQCASVIIIIIVIVK